MNVVAVIKTILNDWRFKLLSGVVGFGLSVVLFYLGTSDRSIYFDELSVSRIYDSHSGTRKIKIFVNDSVPINSDVYVLSGIIWNSGEESIKKDDVIKPITIHLSEEVEIVDLEVSSQTVHESEFIDSFTLSQINPQTVRLDWKYFEPGDGCRFQIIYTGYEKSELKASGKISKVETIEKHKPNAPKADFLAGLFTLCMGLYITIFSVGLTFHLYQIGKFGGLSLFAYLMIVMSLTMSVGLLVYGAIWTYNSFSLATAPNF